MSNVEIDASRYIAALRMQRDRFADESAQYQALLASRDAELAELREQADPPATDPNT